VRTRVKICGLTRAEDVRLAAELGADALGFIFAPSKRQLMPQAAMALSAVAPPWVSRVGVFGPDDKARAAAVAEACRLDTLQMHGEPDPAFLAYHRGRFRVVQALGVGEGTLDELRERIDAISPYVHAILLDTARPGQLGGTGEAFDWSLLPALASPVPVIVAGGLSPENVGTLIAQARPWGLDVASGVEASPGVKDAGRLRAFFEAVGG
jgi:phosphoribosylanthranilate isomerase